ncbi:MULTISPECIES: GNAT family N-acetyltransferase [Mucilaginibacter]|uniref:GNAT family N-acetyltransferase n=1 Tax=Mucilaginibacter TaxID=423349 RepID=UPI0008719E6C|nr:MULTISPECIES: GNAT family N-acetyltransferase [Mucilaginibacter]GGA90666.1 alanine acetyltransferase [Mucilaginibacter rubeus]SCW43537.1 ribosomal-protein-alanine N-acetyltransferase [Mucilaginibacter sp. NFR10]
MIGMHFLNTDRLGLRGLLESDALQILALRSNVEVNKHLDRAANTTVDEALSFIKKIEDIVSNNEGFYWAITLKDKDELIGTICYWNLNAANKSAEIGYELHPDYHGQGFMQEAISAVLAFGFNDQHFELITACPKQGNESSVKLLKKTGFSLAGDFTDEETKSKYLDFRLTKADYLTRSS